MSTQVQIWRARLYAFSKIGRLYPDLTRYLNNGTLPGEPKVKEDFEILENEYFGIVGADNQSPLRFDEITSFNTWFAMHPEKVAGKEMVTTSLMFPITIKGNKEDILKMFDWMKGEKAKVEPDHLPDAGKTISNEPWEMTRDEFYSIFKNDDDFGTGYHPIPWWDDDDPKWEIYEKIKPLLKKAMSPSEVLPFVEKYRNKLNHFLLVRKALAEGKPVPAEVLKDYPELQATSKDPLEMTNEEFTKFYNDYGFENGISKFIQEQREIIVKNHKAEYFQAIPNHELTQKEYILSHRTGWTSQLGKRGEYTIEQAKSAHKSMIEEAIENGLKVPAEVLKDYPELKKGKVEPAQPKILLKAGDWVWIKDNNEWIEASVRFDYYEGDEDPVSVSYTPNTGPIPISKIVRKPYKQVYLTNPTEKNNNSLELEMELLELELQLMKIGRLNGETFDMGEGMRYDVEKAYKLIKENKIKHKIITFPTIEISWMIALTKKDKTKVFSKKYLQNEIIGIIVTDDNMAIMIDGNHRAYDAIRKKLKTVKVYYIPEKEVKKIKIYRKSK